MPTTGKKPKFVKAGDRCAGDIYTFLSKFFKKDLWPNCREDWARIRPVEERSKSKGDSDKAAWNLVGFTIKQLGFNVTDLSDGKSRYSLICIVSQTKDKRYLQYFESDTYGYPIGNPSYITDAMIDPERQKAWIERIAAGNQRPNWNEKVGNKILNIHYTPNNLKGERCDVIVKDVETTLARFLVRNCGVSPDDPRLNSLANFQAEQEARENPSNLGIEILKGKEIMNAYKNSRGANSCMVAHNAHLTEMYSVNPEQVGLALLKSDEKHAIGRCLIWFHISITGEGDKAKDERTAYVDRMYPECTKTMSYFKKALEVWAKNNDWKLKYPRNGDNLPIKILKLNKDRTVPYMDTYRFGVLVTIDGEIFAAMGPEEESLRTWMTKNCTPNKAEYEKGSKLWLSNGGTLFPSYYTGGRQIHECIARSPIIDPPKIVPKVPSVEERQPLDASLKLNHSADSKFVDAVLDADDGAVVPVPNPQQRYHYYPPDNQENMVLDYDALEAQFRRFQGQAQQ